MITASPTAPSPQIAQQLPGWENGILVRSAVYVSPMLTCDNNFAKEYRLCFFNANLDVSRLESSSVASTNTTPQQAHRLRVSGRVHLSYADLRYDAVLREGAGSHEVEELLALAAETGCTVRHNTRTYRGRVRVVGTVMVRALEHATKQG